MVFRSINEAEPMALLSVVKEVISLGLFPLVVKGDYAWAMRRAEGHEARGGRQLAAVEVGSNSNM